MATSGSIDFSQTRDQIITMALKLLGVVGEGETPSSNAISDCAILLNMMIKGYEAQGARLWKQSEAVVALRNGVNKYTLSSSGDHAGDNAIETVLSSDAGSAATSLTVTSTTGMTAADNIGIQLDDNTMFFTTIVSVDSSTTLTITSGLTSSAASGNLVLTYTSQITKPLEILNCRYKYKAANERRLESMGRTEFMQLPNKDTPGPSSCFFYAPQLSNGLLYIWPTPDTCGDTLHISYYKTIEDFDASGDSPDFPQEWIECLTYNLAVRAAPAYGISLSRTNPDILQIAQTSLFELLTWDTDEGSVRIVPNYRWDD